MQPEITFKHLSLTSLHPKSTQTHSQFNYFKLYYHKHGLFTVHHLKCFCVGPMNLSVVCCVVVFQSHDCNCISVTQASSQGKAPVCLEMV